MRKKAKKKTETRGRKPAGDQKRTLTVKVSVNADEKNKLQKLADKAGKPLAAFLRDCHLPS